MKNSTWPWRLLGLLIALLVGILAGWLTLGIG
jgi:hypothetical protein